ncbi:formate dehydrogenase [Candidatus Methylacidiphilum fumarolicum]|uniref:Formate dehydrogenase beta subunit n=2 Tax=Candidatus Methylacidiphilum fumarolicum TaxID=591154 RepID=I0JZV8_METFB|nr:NADH-quinone oxidoreductase subunit NuoF [Candidatus Methylacidiphilum fumarolicum]MBW6415801.1 NADH-quinone oxidoreductase subunit NuoF [Candidatus Methylacidiphilum fumarolicum]TFE66295.1 formate dehydrogenase [Candidatus Methylacidiphilum fumarolicum]TFE71977.1 formate dehydrogenase [Candidatus Methylacidiphilum fumarolicum]TFE73855.1 formate dehydrogenase [Candidatus Methylacidiphilum fumarolicum]TFE77920.1 formate dehydrogenase [Candidatus Methylacidiphilum fumarolicum]
MHTLYIAKDYSAIAVGADEVAFAVEKEAFLRNIPIRIVRTGSYGLYWLEPVIEVELEGGRRIAYGPVTEEAIGSLFDSGFLEGSDHPLCLGNLQEHPYLKKQTRLIFERIGKNDPLSLDSYMACGGFQGLKKAIELGPDKVIDQITKSGLRGRGGAAFPTGIKWKTTKGAIASQKYIVCNADEGDSGTFSDRMVMEGDPFLLIEGMAIAGFAVGADKGYIYLRSEYPLAHEVLNKAIAVCRSQGILGSPLFGSSFSFDLEVFLGAGAYVCGEETALLESLEGKRGMVRPRPPLPALKGLWGKPTVINNVITLASVPWILSHGGEAYAAYGVNRSKGTLPVQLSGNLKYPGLVEVPFGISLRDLVYGFGGGTRSGRPLKAIQIGGPLGPYLPEHLLDIPLDYEELSKVKGIVGHGGIIVFDDQTNLAHMAHYAMEFCAEESCGKCTPCRIGSTRGMELMEKILMGKGSRKELELLFDLCDTMLHASLCGLGGMTPFPVLSALRHFPEDFGYSKEEICAFAGAL